MSERRSDENQSSGNIDGARRNVSEGGRSREEKKLLKE